MVKPRLSKPMTMRDIMTRDVVTVEPENTLREVVNTLAEARVSGAPVMSGDCIVGVISRSDIFDFIASTPPVPAPTQFAEWGEYVAEDPDSDQDEQSASFYTDLWEDSGADVAERMVETQGPEWDLLAEYTASNVMTRKLEMLPPNAGIGEAARRLLNCRIHRLLIVTNGKLQGIVSTTDLVRLLATPAGAA